MPGRRRNTPPASSQPRTDFARIEASPDDSSIIPAAAALDHRGHFLLASNRLRGDPAQVGQYAAHRGGPRVLTAHGEVKLPENRKYLSIDSGVARVRPDCRVARAECFLRFLYGLVCTGGEECEYGGTDAGRVALRDQNGFVHDAGINAIERFVLLRDPAGIDDAAHRHPVLLHPLENYARVKGRSFNRREELILRRAGEPPSDGGAAQLGIYEHRAVAVVP